MVKVTENWAATLRAMKVGDIVVFPVRAISSVNTTISRLRLEMCVENADWKRNRRRLTASAESSKSSVCHDYAIRARASCRRTILQGLADKEVADSLQRSEWTIKAQKRIYTKSWVFPKIPSLYYTCSVSA